MQPRRGFHVLRSGFSRAGTHQRGHRAGGAPLILPSPFEHPQRIQRNPFAGMIALLKRPGAGDRAAQPSSLAILAIQHQFKQRRKTSVTGVTMRRQRLQRAEQIPGARDAEGKPAFVLAFEIIPGIQQRIRQALHSSFVLRLLSLLYRWLILLKRLLSLLCRWLSLSKPSLSKPSPPKQ